jgi:hypothetical protein
MVKQFDREAIDNERQRIRNELLITMAPHAFNASGWKTGDKPIQTAADRAKLARDFTDEVMKYVIVPTIRKEENQ